MKRIILALLLAPFLLVSQTVESLNGIAPDFTVTDIQGNEHNLYYYLDKNYTVVLQFHSTSATCWPSYDSVANMTEAYYDYGCNRVIFINIAWNGNIYNTNYYADLYRDPNIPFVTAEEGGAEIAFTVYPVVVAYECWLIRPDRSFLYQIPNWDQGVLAEVLEDEGFIPCSDDWNPEINNSINIEEHYYKNDDKTIYDLQGRILNEIPKNGFYIQGGNKYIILK